MGKRFTIVGVDPGTTVGIAQIDLDGRLIDLFSSKEFSINDIIERIRSYGYPVIIATDVTSVPQTVEKIAASLDAKLYLPRGVITLREKNEIAKNYPVHNAHERDSLSAAIKAHQQYHAKFENIDARLREMNMQRYSDEVKSLVLKDYSVSKAIDALSKVDEPAHMVAKERPASSSAPSEHGAEVAILKNRLKNQRSYINELESSLKQARKDTERIDMKLKSARDKTLVEAKRSDVIRQKTSVIRKLQQELAALRGELGRMVRENKELKDMRSLQMREEIIITKVLDQFSKSEIAALDERFGIRKDDIIYVRDSSGGGATTALALCERRIKALITDTEMSHTSQERLTSCGIAIFPTNEVPVKEVDEYAFVDRETFDRAYEGWITRQREAQRLKSSAWLEGLIKDYRYERKKEDTDDTSRK